MQCMDSFRGINVLTFLWGLIEGTSVIFPWNRKKRGCWKKQWILCPSPHYVYECHCAHVNPEQVMPLSNQWASSLKVKEKLEAGKGQASEWEGKACWDHNPFNHVKTDLSYCSACRTSITFRSHSLWKHSGGCG